MIVEEVALRARSPPAAGCATSAGARSVWSDTTQAPGASSGGKALASHAASSALRAASPVPTSRVRQRRRAGQAPARLRQGRAHVAQDQMRGIGNAVGMGVDLALEHEDLALRQQLAQVVVGAAVAEPELEHRPRQIRGSARPRYSRQARCASRRRMKLSRRLMRSPRPQACRRSMPAVNAIRLSAASPRGRPYASSDRTREADDALGIAATVLKPATQNDRPGSGQCGGRARWRRWSALGLASAPGIRAAPRGRADPGRPGARPGRAGQRGMRWTAGQLRVSADGWFVFGFGRDAAERAELVVRLPDGAPRRAPARGRERAATRSSASTGCRRAR